MDHGPQLEERSVRELCLLLRTAHQSVMDEILVHLVLFLEIEDVPDLEPEGGVIIGLGSIIGKKREVVDHVCLVPIGLRGRVDSGRAAAWGRRYRCPTVFSAPCRRTNP